MQHLDQPLVCPILVGRAPHLEALERCLTQVIEGRGQTLLVAGEAGVGKSRLVNEARQRAARRGMAIVQGHAFEAYQSLPYAPLVDLLRTAGSGDRGSGLAPDELARLVGPSAPVLTKILPELTAAVSIAAEAASPSNPEHDRHQLFRALVDVVRQLAAARPVLFVIEDAHWSDDASLDFLGELARAIATTPVLLLMTYRDDEVSLALSKLLASLDRQRLAAELRLQRLDRNEVGEMLQATCGLDRPVRPAFLDTMVSLTDGNPFFLEEVLRALVVAGEIDVATGGARMSRPPSQLRVPRSVRDAVERRAERLSDVGRRTLALAAVAGHRFDFDLLRVVTGEEETPLLGAIKEMIAAGLVVEESSDRFAFRHALTREAIREGLLRRERQALHREIAAAIEQVHGHTQASLDAHAEDLAYHFHEAAVWAKSLLYAPRAGQRAQALYAPRAAVEHFTRALEAGRQLGSEQPSGILLARGRAFETLGEFEAARTDFEAALALARSIDDRCAEWQALVALGAAWTGRSYQRGGDYYQQALDVARQVGDRDPLAVARTLNCIGNWHTNLEQPVEAVHHHQEALSHFRAVNDRPGVAETLDYLGIASFLGGDIVGGTAYLEQAITLFRQLDDRHGLSSALATLALRGGGVSVDILALPPQQPGAASRNAEMALAIARQVGWRSGESYALGAVALTATARGEYTRAVEAAGAALSIAEEIEHREWMVFARSANAVLFVDLLFLPAARRHYEQALALARQIGSLYWIRLIAANLAWTCAACGDVARAESLLNEHIAGTRPGGTWAERALWVTRAELALASGDPAAALQTADELIAAATGATNRPIRRLAQLRGEALAALGRSAEAEAALLAAREVAAELNARPVLWRIDLSLSRTYGSQGRQADADRVLASARSLIQELASGVTEPSLREGFLARATALLPQSRPLTPRRAAKAAFGGLTQREREVAVLVGLGKSNREIAEALVLGERTVQTHVTHILGKLGYSSRAQVAAWAAARGLLEDIASSPES